MRKEGGTCRDDLDQFLTTKVIERMRIILPFKLRAWELLTALDYSNSEELSNSRVRDSTVAMRMTANHYNCVPMMA